jgi:cell division protease FtsH
MPDFEDRCKLFLYYLSKVSYSSDIKIEHLAYMTVGNSPAEIANIVNEAALISLRDKRNSVIKKDLNEARERIALGIKLRIKMTKAEKLRVAYHEAGHLLVTYLLVPSKDVFKATIIPRGKAGGATWMVEREELLSRDKFALLGEIKIAFAGYLVEKMKFGITSTGVDADFKEATLLAHNMAWCWGMGKSGHVGNFEPTETGRYMWAGLHGELDADAKDIIHECMAESEDALKKNWDIVDRLATTLFEKEEIEFDEIECIFKEFGKERSRSEEAK